MVNDERMLVDARFFSCFSGEGSCVRDSLAHAWTLCPCLLSQGEDRPGEVVIFHQGMSVCNGDGLPGEDRGDREIPGNTFALEFSAVGEMASIDREAAGRNVASKFALPSQERLLRRCSGFSKSFAQMIVVTEKYFALTCFLREHPPPYTDSGSGLSKESLYESQVGRALQPSGVPVSKR